MQYIEMNSVRADMVDHPAKYRWSSFAANALGEINNIIRCHDEYLGLGNNMTSRRKVYRQLFEMPIDKNETQLIQQSLHSGTRWEELADYYSDILYRVMLKDGSAGCVYLLFEHKSYHDRYVHLYIFKPELQHKLPEIFSLLHTLMKNQTGLQYLKTVIRYLASVLDEDELSLRQIKEMAEQAISKETGGYIMTLAEKLRKEGEKRGQKKGYREAIELGIALKFPGDLDSVMAEINKIDDLDTLVKITKTIKTANDISQILALIK